MAQPDFYALLGLPRNASLDDIKRAYRRLAITWHPDRNPGSRLAEEKFKAIAEAYAVLSAPQKRQQYDMMGPEEFRHEYSREDIFKGFEPGDLFRFFGLEEAQNAIDLIFSKDRKERPAEENMQGRISDFFSGFGQKLNGPQPRRAPDIIIPLVVTLREAVFGAEKTVAYNNEKKEPVKLPVSVPQGAFNGQKITLKGKGPGRPGTSAGSVIVALAISADPEFALRGHDLLTSIGLTAKELAEGARPVVKTLDGRALRINVPAGTAPGTRLKIPGHGGFKTGGERGDLLVSVKSK